ncbi:B3 domain-containing protein At5g42700-like isoform X2 [Olea europaea var. sylvestris]|uniref:B3 domain-containing protein At5g42700-like isoform X2 n=1 Tax=Olea europaea var. sylvestris TaxID=158386 RepID=UPI000C1CD23A|nr:B3 domain-containing protein At5g42700-like isoform X2 [Olea europaea var. sylvestris]
METKKLKEKLYEIETQNCREEDETDLVESSPKKRKRMQSVNKKETVSKRQSLKSKDKQVSSSNSKKSGSKGKRSRFSDIYEDVEAKFSVMERAERVLARLENDSPSFGKCMLPSNVAHGFWLHLPKIFCSHHLPNHDATVVLVDEWENEYETSYLLYRHGLSAGWRGFSVSHRLLKGDILIFHLIEPCKLKVQIVRVNDTDVVEAALCLLNMDACRNGMDCDIVKKDNKKRKKVKYVEPFLPETSTPVDTIHGKGKNAPNSRLDQSLSNSDGFRSKVLQGSEITNRLLPKEYCYSETPFLPDHPHKGVTCR